MARSRKFLIWTWLSLAFGGCAGNYRYFPPSYASYENRVVIKEPFDRVWNNAVRAMGESFFVINNIAKDSKIINLSYSGDPEKYVDCGRVSSTVTNLRGTRTYDFPAARKHAQYERMDQGRLFFVDRNMSLEGRINLLFEELSSKETAVKVNVRYVVSRTAYYGDAGEGRAYPLPAVTHTFNSGQSDSVQIGRDVATCRPTGLMERELLESIVGRPTVQPGVQMQRPASYTVEKGQLKTEPEKRAQEPKERHVTPIANPANPTVTLYVKKNGAKLCAKQWDYSSVVSELPQGEVLVLLGARPGNCPSRGWNSVLLHVSI